jgi:hypothetical protein
LAQLAVAQQQVAAPLRHAAAVLLKQYVKQHWVAGERGYEPPGACDVGARDGHCPDRTTPHYTRPTTPTATLSQRRASRTRPRCAARCQPACRTPTPRSAPQWAWRSPPSLHGTSRRPGQGCWSRWWGPSRHAPTHT